VQEQGWSRGRVQEALKETRRADATFRDGGILGSMCTMPHPLAAEAHALFLETNLGDPGHFPGTARLEQEVLADLAGLLNAPPTAVGRIVSGGTEANLLACLMAKALTGKDQVVLPSSAHFSFDKAAKLMGLVLVSVPVDAEGRADAAAMAAAIGPQTALVVAVAGTTELGLVDPIEAIAAHCREAGVLLHVDAAYGGYFIPFLGRAGRKPVAFDFAVPGVWSVAIDPHKGGMATIPCGALLLRDGKGWDTIAVPSPYLSTPNQSTLLGTRPGASVAAAWAVHRHLGRAGFASLAETCLDNATYLAARLRELGVEVVAQPELAVVTFRDLDPAALQAKLRAAGFSLNRVTRMQALRVVVNPHVTRDALDDFVAALREAL
jgi:tyrosine decarboxylase/aspartate 1-decarboxylase